MKATVIRLRFAGTCKGCGKGLPRFADAWYKKGAGVRCLKCGSHDGESDTTPNHQPETERKPQRKPQAQMPVTSTDQIKEADKHGIYFRGKGEDGYHRYMAMSVKGCIESYLDENCGRVEYNRQYVNNSLTRYLSGKNKWANHYTRKKLDAVLTSPPSYYDEIQEYKRHIEADPRWTRPLVRRRVRRGQEFGDEIDVDRFLMRDPFLWDRSVREQTERRVIWIGCNLSANASVTQQELFHRGAAVMAIVDWLTVHGYSVGVRVYDALHNATKVVKNGVVGLVLKEPDQPLNMASMSFALCDIGFFRLGLVLGVGRHLHGAFEIGIGKEAPLPERERKENDIVIEKDVKTQEGAIAWLKEVSDKLSQERQVA